MRERGRERKRSIDRKRKKKTEREGIMKAARKKMRISMIPKTSCRLS